MKYLFCAALGVLSLSSGAATAGSYTLITPYSGAGASTGVLGINDAGFMTGSIYNADGSIDGFIRSPTGVYSTFTAGAQTFGRNISNSNSIAGFATDSSGVVATDTTFVRASDGVITDLTNPTTSAALHGFAQGQNASGAVVGDYYFSSGGHTYRHGFELSGSTFTDISVGPSFTQRTMARGINDAGVIVGFTSALGVTRGFVDTAGVITFVIDPDPANSGTTVLQDINNAGLAVGGFVDAAGNSHAFEFNTLTDTFTNLTPPTGTNYDAFGINGLGQVVLTGDGGNYLYDPLGVPEPGTWVLMTLGMAGLGGALRRRGPVAA